MTNDISATVDALLVVLILCVIFCAGVVIVLNKFFSFLGQQNKLNKVTKKLSCLEQDTQTLIKNTRQITVLYGLLSEHIHFLSEYTVNPTEEKENDLKAEMQAAILRIQEINTCISQHTVELENALHRIELEDLHLQHEHNLNHVISRRNLEHEMEL